MIVLDDSEIKHTDPTNNPPHPHEVGIDAQQGQISISASRRAGRGSPREKPQDFERVYLFVDLHLCELAEKAAPWAGHDEPVMIAPMTRTMAMPTTSAT